MTSFAHELEQLRAAGLHRTLRQVAGSQGPRVVLEGLAWHKRMLLEVEEDCGST